MKIRRRTDGTNDSFTRREQPQDRSWVLWLNMGSGLRSPRCLPFLAIKGRLDEPVGRKSTSINGRRWCAPWHVAEYFETDRVDEDVRAVVKHYSRAAAS